MFDCVLINVHVADLHGASLFLTYREFERFESRRT